MQFFVLHDAFALRKTWPMFSTARMRFPIYGFQIDSYFIFDELELRYVMTNDVIRYECVVRYVDTHVSAIMENRYEFDNATMLWFPIVDVVECVFEKQCRNLVMSQIKNHFYTITPCNVQKYSQRCTPITQLHVHRYACKLRLRIFFNKWKQWFYNPDNVNGYMRQLKSKYGWLSS